MINFISDIVDSSRGVVDSTGDAVDKIIAISNPLAKRENESPEDYKLRLEHLERQKERNLQFKSEQQKAKKQAQLERENIKLERTKVKAELKREQRQTKLDQQQLKQEAKQARQKELAEENYQLSIINYQLSYYLSLPERIGSRPLPPVEIVDMREELNQGNRSIFGKFGLVISGNFSKICQR